MISRNRVSLCAANLLTFLRRKKGFRTAFFVTLCFMIFVNLCLQTLYAAERNGDRSYLKPGDMIRIKIWRGGDLGGDFAIDEDRKLVLPLIGTIEVEEISTDSLKLLLIDKYSIYLKDPYLTVVPLFRINVMGEVVSPGLYTVDSTLGLSDILALAGGSKESGDINKIKVLRDGLIVTKNLKQEMNGDTPIEEFGILSGDQIIVGKKGGISVRDWAIIASMVSATALMVDVLSR
jgi:polysaccharide export outer membrane protein